MDKKYSVAVVGCGRAGFSYDLDPKRRETFSHIGAYRKCKRVSRICAVDTEKSQLDQIRKKNKEIECFESLDEMFKRSEIDILSICTPSKNRIEIVKKAVENDVKAIFCEKPISDDIIEAKKIVRICSENNVALAVNHFRRWDSFNIKISNLIRTGLIGNIQNIIVKYNKGILNTGSHVFDFIRMLSGEIKSIRCVENLTPEQLDPTLSVVGRTHSEVSFFLIGSDHNNFRIFEVEILGEKGRISIDNGYSASLDMVSSSDYNSEFQVLQPREFDFGPGRIGHYEAAVENIIRALEQRETILCNGDTALSSLLAAHTCLISYVTGNQVELSELELV